MGTEGAMRPIVTAPGYFGRNLLSPLRRRDIGDVKTAGGVFLTVSYFRAAVRQPKANLAPT